MTLTDATMPLITRLEAIWNRHVHTPLQFGVSDCAIICCQCFLEKAGEPLVEAAFLDYSDETGALRSVLRTGHRTVDAFLASRLERIEAGMAGIGDLLYCGQPDALAFPGVVLGAHCVSKTKEGAISVRREFGVYGYRVPWRLSHQSS